MLTAILKIQRMKKYMLFLRTSASLQCRRTESISCSNGRSSTSFHTYQFIFTYNYHSRGRIPAIKRQGCTAWKNI